MPRTKDRAPSGGPHAELGAAGDRRCGDDVVAIDHRTLGRVANLAATAAPLALLGVGVWRAWGGALHWQDLVVLAIGYTLTGVGVTVGFHRLLTHRSFKARQPVRVLLAILGSAAVEGPLIEWVATHRMHHRFSDRHGDPHSPHLGNGSDWRSALEGLAHAHLGWLLSATDTASPERYAPDLLADPLMRWVDRTFVVWVLAGLAAPFGLGVALSGTVAGGLTGMLWGGAVRILLLHHATFSVNSLCHFFGQRRFDTGDESRNLAWLALPTLGEAWHNNHHAFPTSARHGLRRGELDPSGWIITALARVGLAWDVISVAPERERARRAEILTTEAAASATSA
jgi:stearoyl-CoA desaturase (delta-9 desaturase)